MGHLQKCQPMVQPQQALGRVNLEVAANVVQGSVEHVRHKLRMGHRCRMVWYLAHQACNVVLRDVHPQACKHRHHRVPSVVGCSNRTPWVGKVLNVCMAFHMEKCNVIKNASVK